MASLSAYRSELRRRRDLYHRNWQWSLWPALPALITVIVGGVLYDERPGTLWRYAASTVVAVVGLTIAVIHYRRKGDQFQCELDALTDMDAK